MQTTRLPIPRSTYVVAAFLIGLTLWVDFSAFHEQQHADALLPIMVSLYRWTPTYWGQDRFGMLVPLLALPITSPLANLLFQDALNIFCAFAGFALLARYLLPVNTDWTLSAALSAALFIAFVGEPHRFDVFSGSQPYATSLVLGLCGLQLLREDVHPLSPGRIALSFVCLILAEWVNIGGCLILAPLVVWRGVLDAGSFSQWRRARGAVLGLFFLVFALALWMSVTDRLAPMSGTVRRTVTGLLPQPDWVPHEKRWLTRAWDQLSPHDWDHWALVTAGVGLLMLGRARIRAVARPRLLACLGLVLAGVSSFLVVGLLQYVSGYDYPLRYGLSSLLLISAGLAQLAALTLDGGEMSAALRRAGAAVLVALAVLKAYGLPGPGHVERAFDQRWGELARETVDSGATHFAGDYWTVWPVVFRTDWMLHDRGDSKRVFGMTFRAEAILDLVRSVPQEQMRVAWPHQDGIPYFVGRLGAIKWGPPERHGPIDVVRPAP